MVDATTTENAGKTRTRFGRMTAEQKEAHMSAAADRAAKRAAGEEVGAVSKIEAMFDKHHANLEKLGEKGAAAELRRDLRAAKKATKIGFFEKLRTVGPREAVGKPALIGAGVVAGAAALGIIATKVRSDRKKGSKAEAMMADPMMDVPPAMPAPVDMNMMPQQEMAQAPQTMMGEQPVEGPRAQAVKDERAAGQSPELGV